MASDILPYISRLESILDAVDGAIVARGGLGAELPVEEL